MIISHVRQRYKDFKFSWKWIGKIAAFILFVYFVSFIFNHFKTVKYFPIKEVKISGVNYTERQEIRRSLLPLVNKGFFVVDVAMIKERLSHFVWIEEASVQRVWPNRILIQVKEKQPLAYWNNSGLLTTTGEIFTPQKETYPNGLPRFLGPEGEHIQMLNYYTDVSAMLAPINFKIAHLELTPFKSWNITLTNGMKLNVGEKDGLTRISHFVKVYPKIIGDRVTEVAYVDLRYPNGLAVRWKTNV